ncbi:protein kinase [Acidisoma cellulosilytica]|uniref:Protein kinase n=1 Tax=Acidisoma cellulosilyticum TaxID=2802395 RepID=A0A963Z1J8_9PROT|nr:leucine-rich repeat-containing protein kinase family protein [Acidisoma cellulosilyticum]MCB8880826.1 protein kinase [Acidisoma cellulosilyticum]
MSLAALRRGDLAGARVLRINEDLTEFPDEIFGLADTLEMLDLSGNRLTTLPADLGRLHRLKIFFGSRNRFDILPAALGDCPSLSQIGCRDAGLTHIPGESLPPALRWLTVTDNAIAELPAALGQRPALQKLLLSGNRLRALPETLSAAGNLELLRISANAFDVWPGWVASLPRLAWLAMAGNPYDPPRPPAEHRQIPWSSLSASSVLGEGASGVVHRMLWKAADPAAAQPVAVKLFKGRMTSDGAALDEMAAMLAIGQHPHLTAPLGAVTGHPEGVDGLVMPLLPESWRPLAGPPSFETCSRDVYDPALRLDRAAGLRLALGVAEATSHLHARGLIHGDLYAHNILWDGERGEAVLSDFGAAAFCPSGAKPADLQLVEMRAWGILAAEIADRCTDGFPALQDIATRCQQPDLTTRPLMDAVCADLRSL